MTDVDELRQALERYAVLAPDGTGVVETATAIHRRRRRLHATGAVLAVLAALVASVPVALGLVGGAGDAVPVVPASAVPSPAYRTPLELTVDLLPGQAAGKMVYGVLGDKQFITVRPVPGVIAAFGDVLVFDPGALDTRPFLTGEKVQVRGHVAYHTTAFHDGRSTAEAVGWPDPSGAWVVVSGAASLNGNLALAENVRLGVPGRVVAPYHLAYVPPGMQVTSAHVRNNDPSLTDSVLAFGGTAPDSPLDAVVGAAKADLTIQAVNRSAGVDSYQQGSPSTLKIAGHDSWWYTDRDPGPLRIQQNGAALFVNAGTCQMRIMVADVRKHPLDELKRMVEGATFRDCTKASTWVPPL